MKLVPVPQSRFSAELLIPKFGPAGAWELGTCVAPGTGTVMGECGNFVKDDGTGYADIEGTPFKAYVCSRCAARILKGETQ